MSVASQIIEVLDAIAAKIGVVIDWSSQNMLPMLTDIFHRFVLYKIWMNAIAIGVCTIYLIVFTVFILTTTKKPNFDYYDHRYSFGINICIAVIVFIILIACIGPLVKLIVVPEVWFAEYVKSALSNSQGLIG